MKSKKIFKIIAAGILLAAMILLIFIRHYHRSTSVKRPKDAYVKKNKNTSQIEQSKNNAWSKHTDIVRGNPIRIYEGERFRLKNKF